MPLYEGLCLGVANDPEILALAAHAPKGQPVLNLFLAAVHRLLLKGSQHPLADFYPSVSKNAPRTEDPYPSFKSFCLDHSRELISLITARLVQTNVINRCANTWPIAISAATGLNGFCHKKS